MMDLNGSRRLEKSRGTGLASRADVFSSPIFPSPITDMEMEDRKRKRLAGVPTILGGAGGGRETFGG